MGEILEMPDNVSAAAFAMALAADGSKQARKIERGVCDCVG
jgi:uncharacterized protein with GYD domain